MVCFTQNINVCMKDDDINIINFDTLMILFGTWGPWYLLLVPQGREPIWTRVLIGGRVHISFFVCFFLKDQNDLKTDLFSMDPSLLEQSAK